MRIDNLRISDESDARVVLSRRNCCLGARRLARAREERRPRRHGEGPGVKTRGRRGRRRRAEGAPSLPLPRGDLPRRPFGGVQSLGRI
eukprot:30991-Pelagococcus_subviridis.AAC.8